MRSLVFLLLTLCYAFHPNTRRAHNSGSFSRLTVIASQAHKGTHVKTSSRRNEKSISPRKASADEGTLIELLRTAPDAYSFTTILHSRALKRTAMDHIDRLAIVWETLPWCSKLSVHQSATILWSIGTLKLPSRNTQVVRICSILLSNLSLNRNVMTALDLSLALVGLARLYGGPPPLNDKLNIKFSVPDNFDRNEEGTPSFLLSLGHLAAYMDEQQIANSVWALGKLGISFDSFDSKTTREVCESIQKNANHMTSQGVSNIFHGLSNLRAKWASLPVSLHEAVLRAISRVSRQMTEKEVTNCISGLGRLDADWESLPVSVCKRLVDRFSLVVKQGSLCPKGLAMSIHGLGRMGASWDALPLALRSSILSSLVNISPELNAQEVSNVLYGLGKVKVDWRKDLSGSTRILLIESLVRESWLMPAQGIANSIWGLMLMGLDWSSDLPPIAQTSIWESIRREISVFNEQELTNTIHAMGKMKISFFKIPFDVQSLLLQSLGQELPNMTSQGIYMVLTGLAKLHFIPKYEVIDEFVDTNSRVWSGLTDNLKTRIVLAIIRAFDNENDEINIKSIIYGLCSIGVEWTNLVSTYPELKCAMSRRIMRDAGTSSMKTLTLNYSTSPITHENFMNKSIPDDGFQNLTSKSCATKTRIDNSLLQSLRFHGFGENFEAVSTKSVSIESLLGNVKVEKRRSNLNSFKPSASVRLLVNWKDVKVFPKSTYLVNDDRSVISASLKSKFITGNLSSFFPKADSTHSMSSKPSKLLGNLKVNKDIKSRSSANTKRKSKAPSRPDDNIVSPESKNQLKRRALKDFIAPSIVYSLSKMNCVWSDLDKDVLTVLLSDVVFPIKKSLLEHTLSEQEVVTILHGLANMEAKWSDLTEELQSLLLQSIVLVAPSLREQGVAMTFLSLAKLGVCWEHDLSESTRNVLCGAIYRQDHLGEHALSSLLYGLAKLNRKWENLHPQVRKVLKEAIVVCHIRDTFTPIGVSNLLYGLAYMDGYWDDLSSSVRMALIGDVATVAPDSTDQQLTNIIRCLAKLGARWSDLPEKLHSSLLSSLSVQLKSMNMHHISTVIFSLGQAKAKWFDLPNSFSQELLVSLQRHDPVVLKQHYSAQTQSMEHSVNNDYDSFFIDDMSSHMNAQDLVMTLSGLMHMGVTWSSLSPSVLKWFQDSVLHLVDDMNGKQLGLVSRSLGKMGLTWDSIGDHLRRALIGQQFTTLSLKMSTADASSYVNGIGTMGALWNNIETPEYDAFIRIISHVCDEGDIQQIASSMHGMALMECQFDKLPESLVMRIINGIRRVLKTSRSNPQALANILYAIGLLSFDVDLKKNVLLNELHKLHVALLGCIDDLGVSKFNEREREQLLMYVNILAMTTSLIEENTACRPIFRVMHGNSSISKLQESVVNSLSAAFRARNAQVIVTDEYSAFDGALPVDVTIFDENDPKCPIAFLEVDGPHHFRNGFLRRKDKLKEFLYRKKHPLASFTRVSYDQLQTLGSGQVAFAIANFITLTSSYSEDEKRLHRYEEHHACSTRNAERELQRALSAVRNKSQEFDMQSIFSIFGDVTWSNYDFAATL